MEPKQLRSMVLLALLSTACYPYATRRTAVDFNTSGCAPKLPAVVLAAHAAAHRDRIECTPHRYGTITTPNGTQIPWVAWTTDDGSLRLTLDAVLPLPLSERLEQQQIWSRLDVLGSNAVTHLGMDRRAWVVCRDTFACTDESILIDLTPALEDLRALGFVQSVTMELLPTSPCHIHERTEWDWDWRSLD